MSSSLEAVGRYKILRPLGVGAMGEVYLALDPNIDRRLAIKTVRLTGALAEIEERKQRLLREAKAAGRLLHPNVVTLFDAGEENGLLYLAFEFVDGHDLSRRMGENPPLSLGQILRWIREIASALEAAHRQGIVHRDIKPSNILIGGEGEAKVADFGIAKLAGAATQLTQTGSVVGSPQYMSPEQIRGEELDGRSDLFSLGVLLYELLSRRRPFEGETLSTLVFQILSEEPIAIDRLHPDLPEPLPQLVHRMLAKNRADRLDAAQVVTAVAAVEQTLPPERLTAPLPSTADIEATTLLPSTSARLPTRVAPPPPPPPPGASVAASGGTYATPRAGRRAALIAVAALILVAVIGWGVLSLFPRGSEDGEPTEGNPSVTAEQGSEEGNEEPPPTTGPGESDHGQRPLASDERTATFDSSSLLGGKRDEVGDRQSTQTALEKEERGASEASTSDVGDASPPSQLVAPPPPPRAEAGRSEAPPSSIERPVVKPPPASPPLASSLPAVALPAPPPSQPSPPPSAEPEDGASSSRFEAAAADAQREMETGLRLYFQVDPDDAVVKTWARADARSIVQGRASQFDPKAKNSRSLDLPGEGDYLITLSREGLPDEVILVEARAARGSSPTPIRASLRVKGRAGPKLVVVSQAVSFSGSPSSAVVYVDGQKLGPASRWPGARRANSDRNLQLGSGAHSLRIEAPGYRPYELTVDVRANASDRRAMIRFELQR